MLEAIIPAQTLGLDTSAQETEEQETAKQANELNPPEDDSTREMDEDDSPQDSDSDAVAESEPSASQKAEEISETSDAEEEAPGTAAEETQSGEDYVELSVADRVLKASLEQCAEEIGAMIGVEVELSSLNTAYISKEEYFSKPGPKSTVTEMLVNGDQEGVSYFIVSLKDSIYFGGTLVMLPDDELSNRIRSGELDGEIEDAYGEVANIISGGIVQNFDEMFPRKFHVKKGNVEAFTPSKVMVEKPKPFPEGEYYSVSASMDCDTQELGSLTYLVPVELLHIPPRPSQNDWGDSTEGDAVAPGKKDKTQTENKTQDKQTPDTAAKQREPASEPSSATEAETQEEPKEAVVAVVYKDSSLADPYTEVLDECGHTPAPLAANQSFNSLRKNRVCGSLLIIDKVDDDAFALIIKIRSETPAEKPLIVAGPDWTRSAVLKAVKYGVTDIIPTPATTAEIREKVEQNLKISC